MQRGRLLCVFAHPDDETFGAGATIAKYADTGYEVFLATATKGEAGMLGDPPIATKENVGDIRAEELASAAEILGIKDIFFMGFRDGTLAEINDDSLLERTVFSIRKYRPHVLITFGPGGISGHPDHQTISKVATEAFDLAPDPKKYPHHEKENSVARWTPLKLYYLEIPDEWLRRARSNLRGVPMKEITTTINTSAYVESKIEAFYCHRTQKKDCEKILSRENYRKFARRDYYVLAKSRVKVSSFPESDLFEGIELGDRG